MPNQYLEIDCDAKTCKYSETVKLSTVILFFKKLFLPQNDNLCHAKMTTAKRVTFSRQSVDHNNIALLSNSLPKFFI